MTMCTWQCVYTVNSPSVPESVMIPEAMERRCTGSQLERNHRSCYSINKYCKALVQATVLNKILIALLKLS